jgi:GNAT superfamily N-acetyltransferase
VTGFIVTRLTRESIGDNVALAHEVGWPDTEDDWNVIHEGALVVGVWVDGKLVAQGALGLYGRAGTIAKMIVKPRFQRQGIGNQILKALLDEAERRAIGILGLVATPFGRPLYEGAGFMSVGEVVGLGGTPTGCLPVDSTRPLESVEGMLCLDQSCLGCSRQDVLRARFDKAIATSSVVGAEGELCGYALATAQGGHFVVGPLVAKTEEHAQALFESIVWSLPGPVRIDVPGERTTFRAWLSRLGLKQQKMRPEMARGGERLPWQAPERFALAAQAWG